MQVIAKKSQSNRRVLKGWRPVVTLLVLAVVAPAQTVQPNPKDQTARANSASLSKECGYHDLPCHGRDGQLAPAYARYMSTPGNNFLSHSWRPDSEANTRSALLRTVWGFVGLMGKNTFIEFWPDLQRHVFHGKH